jgi:4-diphosphocytidyl-2-C-methyl-D-erythritol kinase
MSLPHLPLLLVNPGVAVPTPSVFAGLKTRSGIAPKLPDGRFEDVADLLRLLDSTKNDLEAPARALQPAISDVLTALVALPGALFARMSGSGATCYALFPDDDSCKAGAAMLAKAHAGWWVAPTSVPEFGLTHAQSGMDIGPTPDGL